MRRRTDRWNRSWLLALVLLLGVAWSYHFLRTRPVLLESDLEAVPVTIGNWRGEGLDLRNVPFRIQGADAEIGRIYRDQTGDSVILYVGYLKSQEQDRELVGYGSRKLLHAATKLEIRMADGQLRPMNRSVLQVGRQTYSALFWYELSGRAVADSYRVKFWTIWNALARHQTNGAIVAVFTELKKPSDLQRTLPQGVSFIQELAPSVHSYLPG